MKRSEWFWSILLSSLYIGIVLYIHNGFWADILISILVSAALLLKLVDSEVYTTQIWKPLYISLLGLVILITVFIMKFNDWLDEKR